MEHHERHQRPAYVPNALLSRLVGYRMYSVEFVLNDYVQLRFDGDSAPAVLNCYVWPLIEASGRTWREVDLGYADAMRRLTPGTVVSTIEAVGEGIKIALDTGLVIIHPTVGEVYVEIAEISGFDDGAWMVWRPGEDTFANLQ